MSAFLEPLAAEVYLVSFILGDESGTRFNEYRVIRPEFFQMPAARAVWSACSCLRDGGQNLDPRRISQLTGISLAELFATFQGNHAGEWNLVASRTIVEAWALRQYTSIAQLAGTAAPDFFEIRSRFQHIEDALSGVGGAPLLAKLAAARLDLNTAPKPERVVYFLKDIAIATPGNLVGICAPSKVGKTAFNGAIIAAALSNSPDSDRLGLQGHNASGHALIHIDTEQSPHDHWKVVQTAARRAGLKAIPHWVESYRFSDWSTKDRRDALPHMMREAHAKHGGIHAVLLDGLADFVVDPNDAEACFTFLHELRALATRFECPIFCVLHLNPGSEKSRGHLGSELERKAQSNLTLEKDADGRTVVFSKYQRGAPILKDQGPCFAWNDAANMHMSTDTRGVTKERIERETLTALARLCFSQAPRQSYAELTASVMLHRPFKERAAQGTITDMRELGLVRQTAPNVNELAV